jgi:hypothetical protein
LEIIARISSIMKLFKGIKVGGVKQGAILNGVEYGL